MNQVEKVPCETCLTPTPMLGTKRCDACWEVERRLFDYLSRGGIRAATFIRNTLGRF